MPIFIWQIWTSQFASFPLAHSRAGSSQTNVSSCIHHIKPLKFAADVQEAMLNVSVFASCFGVYTICVIASKICGAHLKGHLTTV